jgi:hypothetical protein
MTTKQIRDTIDKMIENLDSSEATDKFTMSKTKSANMNEAKQKIALSEMSSLGVGSNVLYGGSVKPLLEQIVHKILFRSSE